jgi:hypothetical protein
MQSQGGISMPEHLMHRDRCALDRFDLGLQGGAAAGSVE